MRKLTFEALPAAIAEILERLDKVEQLLSGKKPSKAKVKKTESNVSANALDVNEAAKMLNVSVASMYNYVKKNGIPFEKAGRKMMFSRTALETWKQEKDKSKKKTAKKSTAKKSTAKKSTAKKSVAKKSVAKKNTAKKKTAKKNAVKKESVKKDTVNTDINITPGELITPQEAQQLFNKPLTSVYYQIRTKKLPVVEKKGRDKYYAKNELEKVLTGKQKRSPKKTE